jgi:hypothetical protein
VNAGGFCTECGHRVATFEELNACPACKTEGLPCSDADQVNVSINWHELHILCVWAEYWQRQHDLGRVVYAIAKRLQAQFPDRPPLTLAAELGELARHVGDISVSSADLRRDIAEQTGVETGLIKPPKFPADGEDGG